MHFISVVVPVFNSADCLPELTRRIHGVLQENYELILVNDHSSDNSWEVICGLFKEYKTVAGVNLRINSGQDNALMAGLQQTRGDFVVIMDDDLQHAPEDILKLYDQCLEGYDVCYADFSKKKQAWWKNLGSWFNGKMGEFILNKPRHIYLSPFKIIRKEVVKEIYRYNGPYPYVDGLILTITDNLTQTPVQHHGRFAGCSTYSLKKSLAVWTKHMTGFSVLPLRFSSMIGILSAFIGFLLAVYYILYSIFVGTVKGWTTVVCLLLVIGGLILTSLGIIGEYIGRTYLKVNNNPQYVIKEILRKS
jgi:glycosyltransferase involved in cell wall biosynthesis